MDIRYPKTCKIHEAAAKKPGRYAFNGVFLDASGDQPKLVATDGRMMAVLPVEQVEGSCGINAESDTGTLVIPSVVVKAASNGAAKQPARISLNGRASTGTKDGTVVAEYLEGEYPDYKAVIPKADRALGVTLGINAEILYRLSRALGAGNGSVELILPPTENGKWVMDTIEVRPIDSEAPDARGVIMPVGEAK